MIIGSITSISRPPRWILVPALAAVLVLGVMRLLMSDRREISAAESATPVSAVFFTPAGQAAAVMHQLTAATQTVHLQACRSPSAPIAEALVEAKRRGVEVVAVLDKSNRTATPSAADFFAQAGVPTYIDAKHAIADNEVMIIDGATVFIGPFNFTTATPEKEAESRLVVQDAELAEDYEANWQVHFAHSEAYARR